MRHFEFRYLLAVTLGASMMACGGQPTQAEPSGYFATFIDEQGVKKFQYTLDSPFASSRNTSPTGPASSSGHLGGSSSRGLSTGVSMSTASHPGSSNPNRGRNLLDGINNDLDTQLEKSLRESRYCRNGYQEKERVIEREIIFVRGQCEELASGEDRLQFPNG
jgi:hypothetical protein